MTANQTLSTTLIKVGGTNVWANECIPTRGWYTVSCDTTSHRQHNVIQLTGSTQAGGLVYVFTAKWYHVCIYRIVV